MTTPYRFGPPLRLEAAADADAQVLKLAVHGYLGYDSADEFLDQTSRHLEDRPHTTALHLDCAGLQGMDSMGLSALLMLHRRTTAAHVTLRLDARPAPVDRVLELTGALAYLDPEAAGGDNGEHRSRERAYRQPSEEAMSAASPSGPTPRPTQPESSA
ncbi:STAS domain-containing protein [Streptomyces huasconensis]|uniref:STAS domain-containing protein n=1 Tax=Streptomyces huasconensis TaxID=1854574 RepID=A0ABV3M2U2_9ACTN